MSKLGEDRFAWSRWCCRDLWLLKFIASSSLRNDPLEYVWRRVGVYSPFWMGHSRWVWPRYPHAWKGLVSDQYRHRKWEYTLLRRFCQRHAKLFLVWIKVLLHHSSTTVCFFPTAIIDISDVLSQMLILASHWIRPLLSNNPNLSSLISSMVFIQVCISSLVSDI